jgi:2-polyprenyl-3-methyl-5-hydroxy-6-metoxy-1,4-benzoquinol methylase
MLTPARNVITPEYRRIQAELHAGNPNYGVASVQFAPLVAAVIEQTGVTQLLDYGAGKGRLGQTLATICKRHVTITPYDPAIEAWSAEPQPSEMVACIDVLEHIEPNCLESVLDELQRLTQLVGFFTIHTGPAVKVLPDGRNAHLIQQPPSWWLPKIMARFDLMKFTRLNNGFWVVVSPHSR